MTIDAALVAVRLSELERRVAAVQRPWAHPVTVTAVTKGFGGDALVAAAEAGCTRIGENYAQELIAKRPALESIEPASRPEIDFIGRLQSNKVRQLVDVVDRFATVDRPSLADEIAKRRPGARILVQVNATAEPQKGGCPVADTAALVEHCRSVGLRVEGLLTVGPTDEPPEAARRPFATVRALTDELGLEECSMGMTADLEIGVACGSTNIRVGTALFGPRPPRGSTWSDGA